MFKQNKKVNYFILIGSLILSYLSISIPLLSLIIIVIIVLYFIFIKSKLFIYLLFLQPFITLPVFNILHALIDYSNKTVMLNNNGLFNDKLLFVDTIYRTQIINCDIITDYDFLTRNVYEFAAKKIIKKIGFQSCSYMGEWPSRNIALNYLKNHYEKISCERNNNYVKIKYSNKDLLFNPIIEFPKEDFVYIAKYRNNECLLISCISPSKSIELFVFDNINLKTLAIYFY